MKITFSDWSIPPSGNDCEVVFISVTDLSLAGSVEQETKKKSVSFCGKNPGNGLNLTRCTSRYFAITLVKPPEMAPMVHFRLEIASV